MDPESMEQQKANELAKLEAVNRDHDDLEA
jgi:hypothetical protein